MTNGELSDALSNAIVALMADYTGRGPSQSRTYVHENVIVCILHDGLTKGERSLVQDGNEDAASVPPRRLEAPASPGRSTVRAAGCTSAPWEATAPACTGKSRK